jgi:hypothetical protein
MRVNGREIVGTGTVVTHFGDAQIELTYQNLCFRLIFATNIQSTDPARIEAEITEGRLDIKLFHFDILGGTTWNGSVATVAEGQLFLSIYVQSVGEGERITRAVSYTFTTAAEAT